MSGNKKADSDKIIAFLKQLKKETWLSNRKWWPNYLYHFTDITNAVSILKVGSLYSRNKANENSLMKSDNASRDVINNTPDRYKDFVRLYFRPRTPTQYHNEGFIPVNQRQLNAHCPVPIMFLFKSGSLLTDKSTLYSDGNIASPNVIIKGDTDFLLNLNFKDIYHDSSLYGHNYQRQRQINYHRQSEILIRDELDLKNLERIFCRSRAEYETLKNLLEPALWKRWSKIIGVDTKGTFFLNRWPFISKVELSTDNIALYFNPIKSSPYNIKVEVKDKETGRLRIWAQENYTIDKKIKLDLSQNGSLFNYSISIYIDEHIAYQNEFSET